VTEHSAALGERTLFPTLEASAYLAHAAISPPSIAVTGAVHKLLDAYGKRGVRAFGQWDKQREGLRERLAQLLGARAEDVALVAGTTRAITDVAFAIPWQPGDRVVLFRGEFPGNVTPWQRAAELFSLEVVWLDADLFRTDPGQALEALSAELQRGVRLVAVSAVEFQTGCRLPLEEIGARCAQFQAELAVDVIQAAGVLPLNVDAWRADYVTCGAHKFLMGLEGAGFLWVRPERMPALRPLTAGWLSHEHSVDFLFQGRGHLRYDRPLKGDVSVFEGSTLPAVGFAALDASLTLLLGLGIERIFEHVTRYLDDLEPRLVARGFTSLRAQDAGARSAILALEPPPGINEVQLFHALVLRGIVCSLPDGNLRFAPHWPNSHAEVAQVVDAVDEALAELRG
jgi:selenocysteine lyase/cysteine desulfurase